ncbi:hemolysin family protein [Luteimicrobium subarcticum]|uniref:CBS domain containing-hemolysin-like protein n=1 Tax=Luteimicrobium subarcticum TaxID=620910 RepID=A0A2M8WR36_9MICO|nr:hemolysin family protein [Luteimicrobium subarcticum]PJI93364.1 CBS domain containing-hemolysin-like protein [Luteimicrobium subarcticum]
MTDAPVWLLALVALVGIVLAAVLSAGETAVVRVSHAALTELGTTTTNPRRQAAVRRATTLVDDARGTAVSASLLRVLAEMLSTACITLTVAVWLDSWWEVLLVAVGVSLVVAVLLVRLSPRSLGRRHAPVVVAASSRLLGGAVVLTRWLQPLLRTSAPTPQEEVDELRELVERTGESDAFEDDDRELIRSVFELGDTMVREVMVPRTDMITTAADTPLVKALRLFLRSGFSRVPVIGESTDDLLGVLYFKDVVRVLEQQGNAPTALAERTAHDVARPPVFVPESKPVDDLLREMQAAANHIALVVDEYGGIAGLVTIEDLLEEIVGELTDEHDRSGPEVEDLGDGTYRVPARLGLDDLGELFGVEIEDDDVDTAGGLLAKALGKVPIAGSGADVHGVRLVAERVEGRRRRLASLLASRAQNDPHQTTRPEDTDEH